MNKLNQSETQKWKGIAVTEQSSAPSNNMQWFDDKLATNPDDVNILCLKGGALEDLGRYEESLECYNRLLNIDPNCADMWNKKGQILVTLGQYNEAAKCYNQALVIDGTNIRACNFNGLLFHERGLYREAIECFNGALEMEPCNIAAIKSKLKTLSYLCRAQYSTSQHNDTSTAKLDLIRMLHYSGNRSYTSKDYQNAIKTYDKILAFDPDNTTALVYKGKSLANLGRYQDAIQYYDRALVFYTNDITACHKQGNVLYDACRYKDAIQQFNNVLSIISILNYTLNDKAYSLHKLERYREEEQCSDRSFAITHDVVFKRDFSTGNL